MLLLLRRNEGGDIRRNGGEMKEIPNKIKERELDIYV